MLAVATWIHLAPVLPRQRASTLGTASEAGVLHSVDDARSGPGLCSVSRLRGEPGASPVDVSEEERPDRWDQRPIGHSEQLQRHRAVVIFLQGLLPLRSFSLCSPLRRTDESVAHERLKP